LVQDVVPVRVLAGKFLGQHRQPTLANPDEAAATGLNLLSRAAFVEALPGSDTPLKIDVPGLPPIGRAKKVRGDHSRALLA
jgi:hypothetical protein